MERILISETPKYIGQIVKIAGWVNIRRDHGKIIFIDIRDRSGVIQSVVIPDSEEAYTEAKKIRSEYVLEVEGLIKERPASAVNEKMNTGKVEMEVRNINIINESKMLPFSIEEDTKEVREDLRLKYRYLDLRTERMKNNIIMRSKIFKFVRDYYTDKGFVEIETPILTKGTPEGAREYIVPSRLHKGKFYVLPQSPQQFKQLLMVAGFERYFQIAKCFRDEDQRGDRQPEFTQLDIEMSFSNDKEIKKILEDCLIKMVENFFPDKKIVEVPFPEIDYEKAIKEFGTDKPDLRKDKNNPNELAFCWIVNFPLFEKDKEGNRNSSHHPFTAPLDGEIELLDKNPDAVHAKAYDLVLNGFEIGGGSIRIHRKELQHKIFKILGLKETTIQRRFGHMLKAFEYGAPPHGGIASGLDRIVTILMNEPNIREIMAFPKTGEAEDLMMEAPSELDPKQLSDLGIRKITKVKIK